MVGAGEDGGGDKRQRRSRPPIAGADTAGRRWPNTAGPGDPSKAQTQHGGSRHRQRGGALSPGCAKNTQRCALKLGKHTARRELMAAACPFVCFNFGASAEIF